MGEHCRKAREHVGVEARVFLVPGFTLTHTRERTTLSRRRVETARDDPTL